MHPIVYIIDGKATTKCPRWLRKELDEKAEAERIAAGPPAPPSSFVRGRRPCAGFSFLELVASISIIAILSVVALPYCGQATQAARAVEIQSRPARDAMTTTLQEPVFQISTAPTTNAAPTTENQ